SAVAAMLVSSSVRTTFPPAITPPEESVTVPVSCAVYVAWERRRAGVPSARRMVSVTRRIVDIRPPMKVLIAWQYFRMSSFTFLFFRCQASFLGLRGRRRGFGFRLWRPPHPRDHLWWWLIRNCGRRRTCPATPISVSTTAALKPRELRSTPHCALQHLRPQ